MLECNVIIFEIIKGLLGGANRLAVCCCCSTTQCVSIIYQSRDTAAAVFIQRQVGYFCFAREEKQVPPVKSKNRLYMNYKCCTLHIYC